MTTNIFKSVNPDEIIIWSSLARHVDDAIYMMDDGYHLPKVVLQQSIYVIIFGARLCASELLTSDESRPKPGPRSGFLVKGLSLSRPGAYSIQNCC